jgi:hypothetical protein
MKPFIFSETCLKLVEHFPPADILKDAALGMKYKEKEWFMRLWLSEGIPFAFRDIPVLYEAMREWIGGRLEVHPKMITIIGSARIGYSLAPTPEYGRSFGLHSDLDLSLISETLFSKLSSIFYLWKEDIANGKVKSRNAREQGFWENNLNILPQNISRGFIDTYKIPSLDRYSPVQRINQTMFLLKEKLTRTPNAPKIRKATIRVYKSWDAFISQMLINFSLTLNSFQ